MIEKIMTKKGSVALLAMLCCALWGISTPVVKMGYNHIDETHIPSLLLWVGTQFIVAGLIAIGIQSIFSKKVALPKKESLKGIAIVSVLQTVLQYSLMYIGLSQTSSVKGAILKSTDVFIIVLIASLFFKLEKLTVKKLVSCIIGFLGIIIMNLDGLSFQISPIGDGLVLLSVISYSFSVIMIKFFAEKEQPIILCGYQMSLGGIVLMVLGLLLGGKFDFVGMLPVFICLSLIYSVSYVLWTVLLKYNPASSVSIYSFMTPVFGVIFSSLLLSEDGGVATLSLIIALVLVCAGIILWGYEKPSKKTKA
ncbi:MAG: DMT family transporter [Clostridia bacterium]|nr:DMT family transporter [Clostridia bacterium]